MACCAVIALVIGLVRGAWFRIVPGARPPQTPFAPPVRRPLGSSTPRPVATRASRPRLLAPVLRGVALGILGYAAFIAAALLTGLAEARSTELWALRDIALVMGAGTAATFGLRSRTREPAAVLLGAGIAWSELGLIDMHLLRLFTFPHEGTALDLLFHGSGFILVLFTLPRVLSPIPQAATR